MTKKYKNIYIFLSILSWVLCFGITTIMIGTGIAQGWGSGDVTIKEKLGSVIYSYGISFIILLALSLIVKDQIRPTVWMANVILTGYLYNMTYVYIVFAIWFIDTYIISKLKAGYKNKWIINREIDKRER